jgi:flagellin-like protein
MTRKAEMGVGTLIVFIAMLLVAAVAAGVLIQTAGSLQERALSTGQQARGQISTNVRVIEVSATDGKSGNLTDFKQVVKLSPGSDPVKLDQVIFSFNTKDRTSTLKYRGPGCVCRKDNSNGYNTWNEEDLHGLENFMGRRIVTGGAGIIRETSWLDIQVDLDDDGVTDYVRSCAGNDRNCSAAYNNTHLAFNLSTDGIVYVQLLNDDGSQFYFDTVDGFNFTHLNISDYGYINATRSAGNQIYQISMLDTDLWFQVFEMPYALEEDYDDDGRQDYFAVNNTHAWFWISTGGNITVPLNADLSAPPATLALSSVAVDNSTDTLAYLTIEGTTIASELIPANATVTVRPYDYGMGYFAAIYEQEGTNHVVGNLQRGDILRLCYEAPGEIMEDELVRLNFIPKIGTATLTEFVTPDVISTERVYLYP